MGLDRRSFVRLSALAGSALGAGLAPAFGGPARRGSAGRRQDAPTEDEHVSKRFADEGVAKAETPLRILFLGGTGFLGPHTVRHALARGHVVTLFNRGRTNPELFGGVEKLVGDRQGAIQSLFHKEWDVVVDTSGYVPRWVKLSAEELAGHVKHYVFISTISVYRDMAKVGLDESHPLGTLEDPTVEQVTSQTYGPLKALCEQAAEAAMPGRTTSIRPGLIVGPGDPTDRFTYWPARVHAGGEVLAPGSPEDKTSFIDVRDLGGWIVHVAEKSVMGTYNANGPKEGATTMGELLGACKEVAQSDASFTWVEAGELRRYGVAPWSDLPCWIPAEGDYAGVGTVSKAAAVAKGLRFRPVADTVRDTLEWHLERGDHRLRAGLAREREAEVLKAVRERDAGK